MRSIRVTGINNFNEMYHFYLDIDYILFYRCQLALCVRYIISEGFSYDFTYRDCMKPFDLITGNTSDNLEVVSEAPSNHSVASSLELETEDQNDNLSDMVSANVSGRGSPNISGDFFFLENIFYFRFGFLK